MNLNRVTKQAYIDSLRQSLESAGGEIRQLNTALRLEQTRLVNEEAVTAQLKQEIRHLRATVMATTRVIDILNTQLGDNYQSQIYKADAEQAASIGNKWGAKINPQNIEKSSEMGNSFSASAQHEKLKTR